MTRFHPIPTLLFTLALSLAFLLDTTRASDDAALIKKTGNLLFEDKFERDEPTPGKENIGGGWTSNSAWRAKGKQQVDLVDGVMQVTRVPEADHGVAIFHDVEFRDGAVQMKFKLKPGEDLGLDFVDRELKTVHAGHLCMAKVTLKNLRIQDSKTGVMDNKIRDRRKAGEKSPELNQLLKTKSKTFPLKLDANQWHQLLVVVKDDVMRVSINGKAAGEFKSEGIAHPTKRMITLAVNKGAQVDDIKVWKLDPAK